MALSSVQYTADGVTDTFNIPFGYLSKTDIQVRVDGVLDGSVTFPTDATVQTSAMPNNGAIVEVKRVTPNTNRAVDFQDGSLLSEEDLDQSALQNFYIMQELYDDLGDKLGLTSTNVFDAQNKKIINLALATDSLDAASKQYVDNVLGTWAPKDASYLALAANGSLTSERILTPGTGLTGNDGGAGSTYTLALSIPVSTANGGTGLTSIGTANQLLGVNNAVNGLEYKTLTAGTGIDITHGAGSVTINSTLTPYTDEMAQDAVGGILGDTATIDATYNDAGNSITLDLKDNSVSNAKLRDSSGLSIMGRSANSSGDPADIVATNDGDVLRRSGTTLGFGSIPVTSVTGLGSMATQNSSGVGITGGAIDGITLGNTTPATILNVDNIRVDGNTISSTNTNGGVFLSPNGTGQVSIQNGPLRLKEQSAPGTPASTFGLLYPKTDGKLYWLDDGGTEYDLTATGAGGGGGGAPETAQYVTLATDATLTNERVLTAGAEISLDDGGAGNPVTLSYSPNPLKYARFAEDFLTAVSPFLPMPTGGIDMNSVGYEPGHPGIAIYMEAEGDAGSVVATPDIVPGDGPMIFEGIIKLPALSTGSEIYEFLIGFINQPGDDLSDAQDAICFRYSHADNGDFWSIITKSRITPGTTETVLGTAVAADTWYKLRIEVNDDASSVVFKIDDSVVGTHTTNIPVDNIVVKLAINFTSGTPGSTADVLLDYWMFDLTLNTTR